MYGGKYSAVIGLKEPSLAIYTGHIQKETRFSTNNSAIFPPEHQTTEFRQTTA
jgi:hypothetical protein